MPCCPELGIITLEIKEWLKLPEVPVVSASQTSGVCGLTQSSKDIEIDYTVGPGQKLFLIL